MWPTPKRRKTRTKTPPRALPGGVWTRWTRCGKTGCKCNAGQLHGPYAVRAWTDARGKLHRSYIRQRDVDAVRAACAQWKAEQRTIDARFAAGRITARQLVQELRRLGW